MMKKWVLVSLLLVALAHIACAAELKTVEKLSIAISPYDAADVIMGKTAPLGDMLKAGLKKRGWDVKDVSLSVSSSYQACAEALRLHTPTNANRRSTFLNIAMWFCFVYTAANVVHFLRISRTKRKNIEVLAQKNATIALFHYFCIENVHPREHKNRSKRR